MSPWINGLIGGIAATVLTLAAQRWQKPARLDAAGWKMLRPGWLLNGTIAGCAAMAGLGCTFLVVGSTRPDAEMQMIYAAILAVAFGLASLYVLWRSYGQTVLWKGDTLKHRSLRGRETLRRISEVRAVSKGDMSGEYRLTFRDGSTLRLSAYLDGARELVATLPDRARRG